MSLLATRHHPACRPLLLLAATYVCCNLAILWYRIPSSSDHQLDSRDLTPPTNSTRRILLWNPFFKSPDYRFGLGQRPFDQCRVSSCLTTTDRADLELAYAVVFHGPRIPDFPPPSRPPGQIYVYVQEKPNYNPSVSVMSAYDGLMNLTMTYRRDSDIEFPPAIVSRESESSSRPHVDSRIRPRSVVWVVHRCSTPSRREWYVRELRKYIDVDVYGACGDLTCTEAEGEDEQECLAYFQRTYLFYLALEYDVCRDYVSEKIYQAFRKQLVPVVFGGANYSVAAPPGSVIDIRDFPRPRDLAEHLGKVGSDPEAYNEYLAWKGRGYTVSAGREVIMARNFCRLCEILSDPEYVYRSYGDLKGWWVDGVCDGSVIPRMRRTAHW